MLEIAQPTLRSAPVVVIVVIAVWKMRAESWDPIKGFTRAILRSYCPSRQSLLLPPVVTRREPVENLWGPIEHCLQIKNSFNSTKGFTHIATAHHDNPPCPIRFDTQRTSWYGDRRHWLWQMLRFWRNTNCSHFQNQNKYGRNSDLLWEQYVSLISKNNRYDLKWCN